MRPTPDDTAVTAAIGRGASHPGWKKLASTAVVSSDRISNSSRGENRDAPVDQPRHRPSATPGASGAQPRCDSFARGARGALDQVRSRRAAHGLVARPAPAPTARERYAADTGTHWNQLSVIDSEACRRARRTLSVVLDGEASATEVEETARHLPGCEYCARFATAVAELKLCLRAAPPVPSARVGSRSSAGTHGDTHAAG